jgi:hypothetical protein
MSSRDLSPWRRVVERIVAGVSHDLNGRVTAFEGLLHLAELQPPSPDWLERYLRGEVDKLQASAQLLRQLPRSSRGGGAEALQLADLLDVAVRMCSCAMDTDAERLHLEVRQRPVVRAEHDALLEALILAIAAHALADHTGGVQVGLEQRGEQAIVEIRCERNGADVEIQAAAEAAVQAAGGALLHGVTSSTLTLNTLTRSRSS